MALLSASERKCAQLMRRGWPRLSCGRDVTARSSLISRGITKVFPWLAGPSPPYATMTYEEILAFDVGQWAEDGCHLYLWTTNNFMTRSMELMAKWKAKWGFAYKTILTWDKKTKTDTGKTKMGMGSYFRNCTEHMLFAVRGELKTISDSIPTLFEAPVGEHSEKPEAAYNIIRTASYPPYGEVFQRKARPDFTNVFSEMQLVAAE